MSIRDKIRDSLYGGAEDEAKSERNAAAIESFTDSMERPFGAQKRLVLALLVEAVVIAVIFVSPRRAITYAGYSPYFAIMAAFALGFTMAFAGATLMNSSLLANDDPPIEDGIMSGFYEQERRERQFKLWLTAVAGGVFNVILLYVLVTIWN